MKQQQHHMTLTGARTRGRTQDRKCGPATVKCLSHNSDCSIARSPSAPTLHWQLNLQLKECQPISLEKRALNLTPAGRPCRRTATTTHTPDSMLAVRHASFRVCILPTAPDPYHAACLACNAHVSSECLCPISYFARIIARPSPLRRSAPNIQLRTRPPSM